MNNKVLVVGSGYMAKEYLTCLQELNFEVTVVGRGEEKINALRQKFPMFSFFAGGLEKFLKKNTTEYSHAINAVNVSYLKETTLILLEAGVNNILLEKPGDLHIEGLEMLKEKAKLTNSKIVIAYNRRFYISINTLLEEAKKDEGIKSVHFEFTEWVHIINKDQFEEMDLKKWIISNSSHVIDSVFYLIGLPKELNTIVQGAGNIDWHPSGSIFIGSGISEKNIPFSYHSNWDGPGRWAIEVSTNKRRFYLKPMEKLQVQQKGSVVVEEFPINDKLDLDFKPGLFNQTKAFLNSDYTKFVDLDEQILSTKAYDSIGGY